MSTAKARGRKGALHEVVEEDEGRFCYLVFYSYHQRSVLDKRMVGEIGVGDTLSPQMNGHMFVKLREKIKGYDDIALVCGEIVASHAFNQDQITWPSLISLLPVPEEGI